MQQVQYMVALRAKLFLYALVRIIAGWMMLCPPLMSLIKPARPSQLWLWGRLKRVMFDVHGPGSKSTGFSQICYGDFDVLFSNGPLVDGRGIGRVCREQFKGLTELSGQVTRNTAKQENAGRRTVHFYTSVHWCPNVLPPNTVVMIHDVIPLLFPQEFSKSSLGEWGYRFKRIAAQAVHIVTISWSSADAISRLLEVPPEKISVVPNGVVELPSGGPSDIVMPERPYVVFLGSDDRHKNLDVVLRALARPELAGIDLAMIGDNRTRSCLRKVAQLGLTERVHFLGKISDEDVGRILIHSKGLVFPSLYEGFGLPPLEAALLGVPSVCSNRPAMSETLTDAALFVEPDDVEGWATAMRRLVYEPAIHDEVARCVRARARAYTWKASVEQLLGLLSSLAK